MPVSGKFLVCQKPEIIEQNRNKVYGRATRTRTRTRTCTPTRTPTPTPTPQPLPQP